MGICWKAVLIFDAMFNKNVKNLIPMKILNLVWSTTEIYLEAATVPPLSTAKPKITSVIFVLNSEEFVVAQHPFDSWSTTFAYG